MKVLPALSILLAVLAAPDLADGRSLDSRTIDVLSYRIDATIHADRLSETVTIHATSKSPVRKLALELANTMEITACRLDGKDVPFDHSGWELELDLGKAGAPKGDFAIAFELEGKPYTKFSKSRGGFVRTNISPEHAYIRSQYAWYPRRPDDPACYETSLKLRKDWMVRTAGVLEDRREDGDQASWRFKLDKPDRRVGLSAGDYVQVEHKTKSGALLDALVFPGHEEGGKAMLGAAARALDFYAGLFGKIPEGRFTLVEMPSPFGTGSGYGETGYTLIGTGAFEEGGEASWAESLVAHEVSHTWWGHEVGFKHFASESFATYATHRYMEKVQGKKAAQMERRQFVHRVVTTSEKGEVPLDEIREWGARMDPGLYRAHAYEKGAMLLHVLEREMGREAFDGAMKSFFEKYRGQVIDYPTVSKNLCGSKWKWVFNQWGNPGIPCLEEEHEIKKSGSSYAVKGFVLQEGTKKPFRMNVGLRAVSGDKTFDHKVLVKKSKTAFKFKCPFEPDKIMIDPDCHLIFAAPGVEDLKALTDKIFEVANSPNMADENVLRKTVANIRKVLESNPAKESVYHTALGRCLFRMNKLEEAKKEFEIALKGGAGGPFHRQWIFLRLGCIADLEKKRSDAEAYYKKALTITQNGSEFAFQKAERFLKKPYQGHKKDG